MPDNAGYFIRALQPSEAAAASEFCQLKTGSFHTLSTQFCLHHYATIFVCIDAEEIWQGMVVTYVSPVQASKAVIESFILKEENGAAEIASLLLVHSLAYYKNRCVFKIEADVLALGTKTNTLLESQLFKLSQAENGLSFYRRQLLPERICLHNRQMRPSMNTINGEVSEDTLFEYFQKDDIVWGTYSGGTVIRGLLLGRMARNGDVDFNYLQVNHKNEINTGISHSSTEFLNDGRIILYEDWEWTGNKSGGGRSVIEEVKE